MFYHNPGKLATPAQLACLRRMGVEVDSQRWMSAAEANRPIQSNRDKWANLPPTEKQVFSLRLCGKWREGMTRGEATQLLAELFTAMERPPVWSPHGQGLASSTSPGES